MRQRSEYTIIAMMGIKRGAFPFKIYMPRDTKIIRRFHKSLSKFLLRHFDGEYGMSEDVDGIWVRRRS